MCSDAALLVSSLDDIGFSSMGETETGACHKRVAMTERQPRLLKEMVRVKLSTE